MNNNIKIFICATEQSGDNIASNIIRELLILNKNIEFDGVGGSKMSSYLSNHLYSLKDFKSIGLVEIFFSIRKYIKMISNISNLIIKKKYDLIITIDSPDFNYPLVKKLRKNNCKTKIIQIVAPSVWAWRKYRARNFAKVFDELFVLFDFEIKYFEKYNLKTTLIGHPIYYLKRNENINFKNINIAFLPGSRSNELKKLLPFFKLAYIFLLNHNKKVKIFIPTLPHLKKYIEDYVKDWKIDTIISTESKDIEKMYLNINKALVCSGTASLEIAKRNIPQLVIYKLNIFTEILVKRFIKIKFANILNIFANKLLINEITNSDLNKHTFLKQFELLINDEDANYNQINNVNIILDKIDVKYPPYLTAVQRIKTYL